MSLNDITPEQWDQLKKQAKDTTALDHQVGGDHYKNLKFQPIEYIVGNNLGFIEGNIVKYITRYALKGGREDLDKVAHYVELLKELKYG